LNEFIYNGLKDENSTVEGRKKKIKDIDFSEYSDEQL
jgi:hypothetical protein